MTIQDCDTCAHLMTHIDRGGDVIEECRLDQRDGCAYQKREHQAHMWDLVPAPASDCEIGEIEIPF